MGSGPVGGAENHQAEQEEPWPSGIPLSAEPNVPDSPPQPPVIGTEVRLRPRGLCENAIAKGRVEKGKGSAWGAWNSVAGGPAYVFWDQGMYGFAAARIAPRIPMRPPIVPGWPP